MLNSLPCCVSTFACLHPLLIHLSHSAKNEAKALLNKQKEELIQVISQVATQAAQSGKHYVVHVLNFAPDSRILDSAFELVNNTIEGGAATLFVCKDEEKNKVFVYASVAAGLLGKIKAGDWVRETLAALGGKGGGKPDRAQGGSSDVSLVPAGVEAATRVAEAASL